MGIGYAVAAAWVRPAVLHLIWRGILTADLARPLDGLSVVVPAERSEAVVA